MKARIIALGSVALLLVIVVGVALSIAMPTYTHRYRLTSEVEVDGQAYTGSGVIEIDWHSQVGTIAAMPWLVDVKGDAVMVDLGGRGALLIPNALVPTRDPSGADLSYLALWAFKDKIPKITKYGVTKDSLSAVGKIKGSVKLEQDELPQFIYLAKIDDPTTAQIVLPSQFSKIIGGEATLKSVTVEMTDEGTTKNHLQQKLPWLSKMMDNEEQQREERRRTGKSHMEMSRAVVKFQLRASDLMGRPDR